jgi:diaminopimelate epimerase
MRSSSWHAHGNAYLVVERAERLTPSEAAALSTGTDGIVEVVARGQDWAEVVIWNPDGSTAELSGNGTRIAARWLADQTGAEIVRIRVGPREVVARMLGGPDVEQDLGEVEVGAPEEVAGIELVPVSVGNPHAVVRGDPDEIARIGPLLETHPRFSGRTNVQVARVDRPHEVTARVWERGAGETTSSGTSAVAVAAALGGEGETVVHFPGGDLRVRIEGRRAYLTGPAERLDSALRPAVSGDAEDVAAAFTASFRTLTFLPVLHTTDEDRAYVRGLLADREVWVAEEDGRIVGFAALTADELSHLYVHPDAQGRGAGSALLAKAKERRPEGFFFWVFQQNEEARRFYEARGCWLLELTDGSGNDEQAPDARYEWRPSA